MPRLPIDYSKTIIYKICCKDVDVKKIYIGHTTDLTRRKSQHKHSCNNETEKLYNCNVYQFIRENGGWENWSVIPIEEVNYNNVNQALIRERYWIEELKASLNKNIPSRTSKEWHKDNKEHLKEIKKEWYENNKEKFKDYQKEWREDNREKINEKKKEWYENNKEKFKDYQKEWREDNREKINEKKKEYYENNKEKLKNRTICECGGKYTYEHKSHHFKTKKHQNYLSTQTIPA